MLFILSTGLAKGLTGVALLLVSPLIGATLIATQTGIFLYESVAKLVSAYPSRRWSSRSKTNVILHVCVAAGIALQIATLLVPGLRTLLGLELPNAVGMLIVTAAIAVTWAFAELMGRTFGPGRMIRSLAPVGPQTAAGA